MNLPILKQLNVKNKSVLLRIDVNSPIVKSKVLDSPRFQASAETINYLIKEQAKLTIIAHQGRKGDRDFTSLEQHARILSRYTKNKITYIDDLFGNKAKKAIAKLKPGEAILLRNVRYYEDETNLNLKNNYYKEFCYLFNLYINEAFSVSHRNQGSITIPPKYLRSAIGLEFQKEILALERFIKQKAKTKIFILGGSKVEDYFPLFKFLKDKQNKLLIAGVLANLFLIAKNYDLGYETQWIKSHNYLPFVQKLKKIYEEHKNQIILPVDFGLVTENKKRLDVAIYQAPFKYKIGDLGEITVKIFKENLNKADQVFMKGPLGFSEISQFSTSTIEILRQISDLTKNKKIFSIIGGGHLTTTIKNYKISNNFSHISLSGGALIKYISGEKLPGIEALKKKNNYREF